MYLLICHIINFCQFLSLQRSSKKERNKKATITLQSQIRHFSMLPSVVPSWSNGVFRLIKKKSSRDVELIAKCKTNLYVPVKYSALVFQLIMMQIFIVAFY